MSQAGFQQAGIEIQNKQVFGELRSVMERAFSPNRVELLFRKLESKNASARDFKTVLARRVFEALDEDFARSGKTAQRLYESLSLSDQGQIRELYLTAIEAVDESLREKYAKLYRYY